LPVCARVPKLNVALNAVKQRRGHGEKAVSRVAIGNRPDVRVDAEDLLHHHQPCDQFA